MTDVMSSTSSQALEIEKIDHHSVDMTWENCKNFDSSLCFQLKKRKEGTDGNVSNIYTGYATKYNIKQLDSGSCYQFKLVQKDGNELSDWVTVHTSHNPATIHDLCTFIKRKKLELLEKALNNNGDKSSSSSLSSLDAVNDKQLSPLMEAAAANYLDAVKLLLDFGRDRSLGQIPAASVNYADPVNQRTALMHACRNGALKTIEYISIGLGELDPPQIVADWAIYDRSGLTALHWLVDSKSSVNQDYIATCLDWVLKNQDTLRGFTWQAREQKTLWTVLHRACTRGAPAEAISRLVKVCDVHEQDANGQTPLMLAVLSGNVKNCAMLLNLCGGKELARTKSTLPPHRSAPELIGSAPNNKRALRELFNQYK